MDYTVGFICGMLAWGVVAHFYLAPMHRKAGIEEGYQLGYEQCLKNVESKPVANSEVETEAVSTDETVGEIN